MAYFLRTIALLLFDMLKKVTIHVLLSAGMGVNIPWNDQTPEPGYRMTHREDLITVFDSLGGPALLPTRLLTLWPRWLPGYGTMTAVGCAKVEVIQHARSLVDQERNRRAKGERLGPTMNNMLSKLVNASDDGHVLSEREVAGNQVILTAAAYETTSTALAYAMVLLALYPKWQDWVLEEVDSLASAADRTELMEYTAVFPRATRLMALMHETLRLFPPVPRIPKEVTDPQALQTSTGAIQLPPGILLCIDTVALHLLPFWKDLNRESDPDFLEPDPGVSDEHVFRPSRWINPPGSGPALFRPPKGSYLAWSTGARNCPGQKMSQVEFVAVMLTILKKYRVQAAPLPGEGQRETEERLERRLRETSCMTVLQMNGVYDPKENEGLRMRFSKRR